MKTITFKPVRPQDVEPGDIAEHAMGLDPRRVTRVDGGQIWLDIVGKESGPFDKGHYTFVRRVVTE